MAMYDKILLNSMKYFFFLYNLFILISLNQKWQEEIRVSWFTAYDSPIILTRQCVHVDSLKFSKIDKTIQVKAPNKGKRATTVTKREKFTLKSACCRRMVDGSK